MVRYFFSSLTLLAIGTGCAFFTHLILAKTLGAEEYGIYSFIFSLSLIIGVFSLFGFQNSSIKIISTSLGKNKKNTNLRQFGHFACFFTFGLALLSAFLVYSLLYISPLNDKYPADILIIGFLITPFMVLMRLHASFLRGFSKASASIFYETTFREVLLLLFIVGTIVLNFDLENALQALKLLLAALIVATTISWLHAKFYFSKQKTPRPTTAKLDKAIATEWTKLSFPMMLVIILQRLLKRSDIIILGLIVHPALVGAYAIAIQFAEVSSISQKSIFSIFSPLAAKHYDQGNKAQLKKLYTKMQIIGIGLTGTSMLVIALLAPYILEFFGNGFQISYTPLLILMGGQFLNICLGPLMLLMLMAGRQQKAMHLSFITAIGNIICNPIAIYFYGINGAATVTALFLILRGVLSLYDVKKQAIL